MTTRFRLMRAFLWIAVLAWGIGAGAKLYDLIVVAGAWSAAPPESLSLMPYGARFPVGPGQFFAPTSGRHTRWCYRRAYLRMAHSGFVSGLAMVIRCPHLRLVVVYDGRFLAEQSCAFCRRVCAAAQR